MHRVAHARRRRTVRVRQGIVHHPKDIVSQLSECVLPRPRVDRVEKGPRLSDCQRLWQGRRRRAQPLRSHGRHCAVPPRRATWVLRRRVQRRRVPAEHVRNQATRVPDNCNLQCWTWSQNSPQCVAVDPTQTGVTVMVSLGAMVSWGIYRMDYAPGSGLRGGIGSPEAFGALMGAGLCLAIAYGTHG